jgi:hypothetical protein
MSKKEGYYLHLPEGDPLFYISLSELCRDIKAPEKDYYKIRRRLKKDNSFKYNDCYIHRTKIISITRKS